MAAIDLDAINFALRELVRLQLAGELSAQDAWRERQQLLDAVEANWHDVPEQLGDDSTAIDAPTDAPLADTSSARSVFSQIVAYMQQQLWPRLRERGMVWALLGLTVATCVYVASL